MLTFPEEEWVSLWVFQIWENERFLDKKVGFFWIPTKNVNNNFIVPGFFIQPGTENLVSIDVKSFEASTMALDFFSNDKFCFTEKDFQPNHYNLVSRKIILDQDLNYVKPQT